MGLSVGFSLRDFSEVLKIRDPAGQPYILIGGQAVNYWAERYLTHEPGLKDLVPFTSEDIDFKGNRDDVRFIAAQLALNPSYPPKVAMTALSGFIEVQIDGIKSVIEVVRRIPGLSDSMQTPAIQAQWEDKAIRVLDPVSLLACKIQLAGTLSQEKRHDVLHLKILVHCVRSFLRDILEEVDLGRLPARYWLNVAKQVSKLTNSARARKLATKHSIDWHQILPFDAIQRSHDKQIGRFLLEQSPQIPRRSKGISS